MAVGKAEGNQDAEAKIVVGSADLVTSFALWGVYLRKITLFTQSFGLQPSGEDYQ